MTVQIDPNIKKQRIFIDKNGQRITEEQLYGGVANVMGADTGADRGEQAEEESTETKN